MLSSSKHEPVEAYFVMEFAPPYTGYGPADVRLSAAYTVTVGP